MLKRILITGFLWIMICVLGLAQSLEDSVYVLKPVEVSAGQIFKKEDAGMKESRVDSMALMQKVNLSLSDILAENTPVFIKNYGRGALSTASFRGTAASHTQVNWNGMNINTPMSGMVDFSLIPVYIIDDLALKHGSASIADHNGGLGGSVNISNKADWKNRTSAKYMQGIGSYGTLDEFLQVAIGNRKFQSKTRMYHNYSKNDFTFVNRGIATIDPISGEVTHPTETNKNADFKRYGLLQEFYFRPDNNNLLTVRWWFQDADRTVPQATSYEGPDNSNRNNRKDRDNKIMLDWKHYGDRSKVTLRSGYSGKQIDYTLINTIPGMGSMPAIFSTSHQNSFLNSAGYNFEFDESFSFNTTLDFNHHEVVSEDTVLQSGYQKQRNELSWMVSVRKSFADQLNLNLILRQELTDAELLPLVPYLGFDFRIFKNRELLLKGNVARNYHVPSLNDLYWQPGGNPDLLPEEGISMELGLEFSTDAGQHHLKTELTVFHSDIDNWIIWMPSYKGYWEPRNIRRVLSSGIELNATLSGKIGKAGYKFSGTYALTRSVNHGDPLVWGDESYGKQLPYIPAHSGNLAATATWQSFYLTWQHNAYSERFTTSSNDVSQRNRLYPYFMNDLVFGKRFLWHKADLNVELKVYNLFNEKYHSVLYRPMPGRNYMLMLMLNI